MANEQDTAIAYEFVPPKAERGTPTGTGVPGVGQQLTKTAYDEHVAAGRIDPKTDVGKCYKPVTGGTAASSKPKEGANA